MVNYGGGMCDLSLQKFGCLTHNWTDEVAALVLDIGTATVRAGYSGDDTPKAIIPTCYGYTESPGDADVTMGDGEPQPEGELAPPKPKITMHVGNNGPSVWRHGMEVAYPVKNGLST